MRSIDFPDANLTLMKPKSMTDEECAPMTAYRGRDEDGHAYVLSQWMPNKEDLEAINAGRPIFLKILGSVPPPVDLFTLDAEGNYNG